MLKKKSASDFPKADFSVCLSGTPCYFDRTDGQNGILSCRPSVR